MTIGDGAGRDAAIERLLSEQSLLDASTPLADAPPDTPGLERSRRRGPLLVLGLLVLAAFGALGATAFSDSVVYYLTPTEALAQPLGESIRVSGTVEPGTVVFDSERGTVSFVVSDGTTSLPVVHEGPAPDTLKDEAIAVVEGTVEPDGTFTAVRVFAKCASKFESGSEQAGSDGQHP